MAGSAELIRVEIRALRKGRGVRAGNAEELLGDSLRALVAQAGAVVPALITELDARAAELPEDLRTAVRASLGLAGETKDMPHFKDRVSWLAARLQRDERTALRRIDDAERVLAREVALELDRRDGMDQAGSIGWHLDELRTLLRMDVASPEVHEHRRIVATRDGLQEVRAWMDVPPDDGRRPALSGEVLYGGRIVRREQPTHSQFQFAIRFPEPLRAGQSHEYGLLLRIPEDQPMRPHYVMTPECHCNRFVLRVRFDPARAPRRIRRIDGEPVRRFDSDEPVGTPIELDEAGELEVRFERPAFYLGYGARWQM
ncbi:hypothetical protein ACFWNN_26460 [Lentzea sp. NPDC058450]|uniref:hypothetical protein n=1 Tax=Lentzea sp. NPDC058450 TaxID=3346505 RepID=UPI00365BF1CE